MIFYSRVQQTEALAILATLGVPKLKRKSVGSIDDFRAFAPSYFLLIEDGSALRIPASILNEAKRCGHTMIHVKATAAHFQQGGRIEET